MIEIDDSEHREQLKHVFAGRNILLLGPGTSITKEKNKVQKYISDKNPIIVSVNFIEETYPIDYIFLAMQNAMYSLQQHYHRIMSEKKSLPLQM